MDVLLNDSSRVNPRTVGRLVKKKEWRLDPLLCGALQRAKDWRLDPLFVMCGALRSKRATACTGCMQLKLKKPRLIFFQVSYLVTN